MIEKAWEGVTKITLTSDWKKLWSESVVEYDIEESETVACGAYSQRQRDCVFGQDQGLELDSNDIDELVEELSLELTTEELMELHCVAQQKVMDQRVCQRKRR
ncbi:hypothetical protein AVEN_180236-1 [Araneus ventricosus]|uniref:DDE-1 domain-containing protein n=1 Tax=Araneus ventricosus TaxID=182803 RepID=A0A4Y2JUI2_ARAVE|nr:hypothetical protein AVEN_180236-1 [Araneus ventricosus]